MSWLATSTVTPTSLKRRKIFITSSDRSGSRLPVGSSAMRIGGLLTTARAMPTRCCSPVDSSSGTLCSRPSRPTWSSAARTRLPISLRADARDDQRQRDVVEDRAVVQQLVILEHHADLAAERRHLATRDAGNVLAVDDELAAGGPLDQRDQLQQARFAGARMTGEEHDLAAAISSDRSLSASRPFG